MKLKTIIFIIIAIIALVLLVGFIYINHKLNASLPQTDGSIQLSELTDKVEITFDSMGIGQIWAENQQDAMFALGWLHAADRLFQMDLTRRVATGRLSEMLGEVTIDIDRLQRKLGHIRKARLEENNLADNIKLYLQAYTDGINAWVQHISALPFEYQLLGMKFEPWQVQHCLAIVSFQTWYSDALQNRDEFFNKLFDQLDEKRVKQLVIPYPDWAPLTVPQVGTISRASNAWAIAPSGTNTGKPFLVSDPHLDVTRLPQFWYAVGIHYRNPAVNVFGITTPGLPFIVYGHNNYAAWAFTVAGIDITDQYIEKLNPDNSQQYLTPEGWQSFEIFTELIEVKEWDSKDTVTVKITRHGPVIAENDSLGVVYALRWAGFDKSVTQAMDTGFELYGVQSFNEFRTLVTQFSALDANWIYADKQGNIGYQLGTPVPIRKTVNALFRLPGWKKEYDWFGYWQLEYTPHAYNPQQGWLASCNNKPDEENIPYPILGNFAEDRILRITELLESKERFTIEDMKDFQLDQVCSYLLRWKEEAARILRLMDENDLAYQIMEWDGQTNRDSQEIAILDTWLFYVKQFTFKDEFGNVADQTRNRFLFRDSDLEHIYFGQDSSWFDDISTETNIESRDDIALKAMQAALQEIGAMNWGDLNTLTMAHLMGEVPLISGYLDLKRGPFARGGTTGTLNASFSLKNEEVGFNILVAPSWRMIMDLSDLDRMLIVMPAGQSGNPRSNHFFDFFDMWQKGEYWQVPFSKDRVYTRAVSLLTLKPTQD